MKNIIYVSYKAKNGGDGSKEKPFQTLSEAHSKLQEIHKNKSNDENGGVFLNTEIDENGNVQPCSFARSGTYTSKTHNIDWSELSQCTDENGKWKADYSGIQRL